MQIFFKKVIYKVYTIIILDLLPNLDLKNFSKFFYSKFRKYKDINNQTKILNFI